MKNLARLCCALAAASLITAASYSPTAVFSSPRVAAAATNITVNSTSDAASNDGLCTLREAIKSANTDAASGASPGECAAGSCADTINVSVNGVINLTGALPDITSNMSINGPGSGLLTVRRDTGGAYRIFNVSSTLAVVNISGVTVTNGLTANGAPGSPFAGQGGPGGGILNSGVLTLTDVVVTGNGTGNGGNSINSGDFGGFGGFGGGISSSGALTMNNCTVSNNTTGKGGDGSFGGPGGLGAGIQATGTLNMTHCLVTGNSTGVGNLGTSSSGSGGGGGGIYAGDATTVHLANINLTDTVVSGNHTGDTGGGSATGGNGGGVVLEKGTGTLTNCVVSNNTTGKGVGFAGQGGNGGGIFNAARMTVIGSTVTGNSTGTNGSNGGGVGGGMSNGDTLNVINSTISGNTTTGVGGAGAGLWNSGAATLTNSTVAFNSTVNNTFGGAGIHTFNSSHVVTLGNTIVAGNTLSNNSAGPDTMGAFTSQGHNLVGIADPNSTGFSNGVNGDQIGAFASPIDPHLGPLADNGGPTQTNALLAGSPALDAGDNALAKDPNNVPLTTDQRGVGRFGGAGRVVDIGAYEFHPSLEDVADKSTNEDTPLTFSFDVGDTGPAVTSITAASDNQTLAPDAGLGVTGSGPVRTLQITPAANRFGSAHITLTVTYSGGAVASDTFQLNVTPVNDAPSFTKGADQTVAEDAGPLSVNAWATNINAGPNESSQIVSFQVTGNTNPSLFSAAPAVAGDGTLTYTTALNANGAATITLVARDDGGTANGGQDTSAAQTFTITVTPVNDPPTAQGQSVTASEDSARFISFTAADVDNDPLTFSIVSGPSHGTLTGSGSGRTYTPATNYNGPDSFTFKATDPSGLDSAAATVSINVTAVNDPPVNSFPLSPATDQNTPLVFSAANSNAVTVSDVDAGTDPLRVTLTITNGTGTITLGGTANLTFTAGDGADDATMTFTGTAADINSALDGLAVKPNAGFSGIITFQISTNDQGSTGAGGPRVDTDFINITVRPGAIEFKQSSYSVAEGGGPLAVVVRRTGDTSQPASVAYATDDGSIPSVSVPCSATTGAALDRCDFTRATGRLFFAAGETEKTINVLVGDDSYVEGTETALMRLSSVSGSSGGSVVLGSRAVATLEITDDAQEPAANPIDDSGRFVRQNYADFLNREPDAPGLAFWTNEIEKCGADQQCREVRRINVSAAFFLSIEFQQTGYLVYRLDKVAFGNISNVKPVPLTLAEFLSDTQSIGKDVVVGATGWEQKLEDNKRAFIDGFVGRSRFEARYAGTTAEQYVDALNSNAGGALTQEERDGLVNDLKTGAKTRAQVLRAVAEHPTVERREKNQAFVLMQYFGYLRRNPDDAPEKDRDFAGYNFWLGKLNEFNGNFVRAEMVKAFITSDEYRHRFGQ